MKTSENFHCLESPRVCVVIPNHNYGRFIESSIESVNLQTHQPLDLVVVDDGSTDDSLGKIKSALGHVTGPHRKALLQVQTPNQGKLAALNAVQKHIQAPFMLTLDADDRLEPNYVEQCLEVLLRERAKDPAVAMVYTDCLLVDEAGAPIDNGSSTAFDKEKLQTLSYIPEPALCLSKAVLEVMPFDPSIRVGTKHHKWLRMVANGWIGVHLPQPLFHYRMHDGNLSGIGKRVLKEVEAGSRGERILSGYWDPAHA